mgnify:CR=1 FL=1
MFLYIGWVFLSMLCVIWYKYCIMHHPASLLSTNSNLSNQIRNIRFEWLRFTRKSEISNFLMPAAADVIENCDKYIFLHSRLRCPPNINEFFTKHEKAKKVEKRIVCRSTWFVFSVYYTVQYVSYNSILLPTISQLNTFLRRVVYYSSLERRWNTKYHRGRQQ